MDSKNKIHGICDSLRSAILLEYCAGIFRFQYKNGELRHSNWRMKVYSIFLILTFVILFCVYLKLPTSINKGHIVDCIVKVPSIVILTQYTLSMIIATFFFCNSNMKIITIFAELDEQLVKYNKNEFYAQDRIRIKKYITFLFILQSIFTIIDLATEEVINTSEVIIIPIYYIQKLEVLVFCIFILMVQRRLCLINDNIAKFLEEKDTSKISVFTLCDRKMTLKDIFNLIGHPSASNMKIRDLGMIYDKIGTLCALINDVFNFQLFTCLVYTFIYIVITIWASLDYYRTPENSFGPLITIAIWCLTSVLIVMLMCFVCEKLRLVRNTTKILVNQIIMDYNLPKTMRLQAKAFMELIEAWPLHIMIYDMFSVDITLMLKFISVATTYLIIIIQVFHL